jgi:hypothetical protein
VTSAVVNAQDSYEVSLIAHSSTGTDDSTGATVDLMLRPVCSWLPRLV